MLRSKQHERIFFTHLHLRIRDVHRWTQTNVSSKDSCSRQHAGCRWDVPGDCCSGIRSIGGYVFIMLGLVAGTIIGYFLAQRVQMTGMPQLVGLLNGLGGGASVLVAWADLLLHDNQTTDALIAIGITGLIGAVTLTGSLVAYAKLEEWKQFKKPYSIANQQSINLALLVVVALLVCGMALTNNNAIQVVCFVLAAAASSVLGVFLVNPIGGADMPVVISLMNSYSGLAGAATGFVIDNHALIICGSLVGASGVILTQIMCKAMNRSLTNVLFGVMAGGSEGTSADEVYANVRSTSADDIAMILDGAQRVVIVPGYGMAVAQAQHAVRDLSKLLESRGVNVEYAIHPVAGRMPGHMNVLLAEADISYDKLKEMDEINPIMDSVDVAIVIKRSLSPGFAGIQNPLFALPNTLMYFADGQAAVMEIVKAIKENA